jgi:hypothetical protein
VSGWHDTGSLRDARETSRLKQSPVGATNNGRIAMVPRLITASFVSSLKGRLHLHTYHCDRLHHRGVRLWLGGPHQHHALGAPRSFRRISKM